MITLDKYLAASGGTVVLSVLALLLVAGSPDGGPGAAHALVTQSTGGIPPLVVDPALVLEPSGFRFPDGPLVRRAVERSGDRDVQVQLRHFLTHKRGDIGYALAQSTKYMDHVVPILRDHGLPEELFYLCIIESGYHQSARSHAGAVGMWQMIRATSSRFGLLSDPWVDDRMDFIRSTEGAAKFIRYLADRYDDWDHVLAAYNSGEGRVNKAIRRARSRGLEPVMSHLRLPRETRIYVPAFYAALLIAMEPERYGIFPDYQPPMDFFEVRVPGGVELAAVARSLGCNVADLKQLNRSILKDRVPPVRGGFLLKIPCSVDRDVAKAATATLQEVQWLTYRVRKGDTLWDISRKHGVSISRIDRVGKHRGRGSRIYPGDLLLIPVGLGGV